MNLAFINETRREYIPLGSAPASLLATVSLMKAKFIPRSGCVAIRLITLFFSVLLLSGCESIRYYGQAIEGQLSLWWQRESIETLLSDPTIDEVLQRRLTLAQEIRTFASHELGLPDNNSYRYYTDLHRSHVVWNVFAAPEFSVEPKQWCFPVAGCVNYRGYFSQSAAEAYAGQLQQQGFDTYVGGVKAYSTLGWFDDPLLNTFLHYDDIRLAGLIFHELAHQQLYLPGDTTFNESFATAVELEGVRRWLAQRELSAEMESYLQSRQRHRDFVETMLSLRRQLTALYETESTTAQLREQKQAVLDHFVTYDYPAFKQRWEGHAGYDRWVAQGLNNAKLLTLSSYHQWLGAFQQLLAESKFDLPAFYLRVESLAALDEKERNRQLKQLAEE
jgi:predicted aminopeptidase